MARKRLVMEVGMGTDLHGQDYTKAAVRGLRDALWHNSLTIAPALGYSRDSMQVDVEVGVARPELVDVNEVASVLQYGVASVSVVEGGLDVAKDDGSDITVIANVAAIVYLDIERSVASEPAGQN